MMIDANKDCVTKSNLTMTVKTLRKYNDRIRVAAKQTSNKQANRLRDTETNKHLGRKTYLTNKKTYLKIEAQVDILWTHAQRELNKK